MTFAPKRLRSIKEVFQYVTYHQYFCQAMTLPTGDLIVEKPNIFVTQHSAYTLMHPAGSFVMRSCDNQGTALSTASDLSATL